MMDLEWDAFKQKYDRHYPPIEDEFRHLIFLENKSKIRERNELYELGLLSFQMGINQFGDLTTAEFNTLMNGFHQHVSSNCKNNKRASKRPNDVPDSIDWRDYGYVTEVKDQGECGSCYSFSATGSLEGQHFAQTGELISLSEQQLVDCSVAYGNYGCQAGLMDNAFAYIIDIGGIDTEESYEYIGFAGPCRFNSTNIGANCTGFVDLPCGDETTLKETVGTIGPVSVAVDSSQISFQFYTSGVYYEPYCSSNMLNHGMLVVGYGSEDESDYWIVKNSWGKSWGDEGYIKMARNQGNNCGIASVASYPTV